MNTITIKNQKLIVPDKAIVAYITGDGIGCDVTPVMIKVVDAAVGKIFNDKRKIIWKEILAGEKAYKETGEYLSAQTLNDIKENVVCIKGPLATPVGGGIKSLNVAIRQKLDLYACIRPVKYYQGVPAPVLDPQALDVVIFRENTEDLYSGIEWEAGSEKANKLIEYLRKNFEVSIKDNSGIGIKNMSELASKRLVKKAIQYAIDNKRKNVTLVHKGNIMKFTEGAFLKWGYQVAKDEFADYVVFEKDGVKKSDKIIIKDRIADNMFQQILLNPASYDVIATPNLNGDYISDLCAAQVGGLGIAPGANIGETAAVFEATHGTAPDIAGKNMANPCSIILSAVLMLKYMGWTDAAKLINEAVEKTIKNKILTSDFSGQVKDAKIVSTSAFADAVINSM